MSRHYRLILFALAASTGMAFRWLYEAGRLWLWVVLMVLVVAAYVVDLVREDSLEGFRWRALRWMAERKTWPRDTWFMVALVPSMVALFLAVVLEWGWWPGVLMLAFYFMGWKGKTLSDATGRMVDADRELRRHEQG